MKKQFITSLLMTLATSVLLGLVYPIVVTAIAQVCFRDKANGQIIFRNGNAIGSRIIGQPFTGDQYFHSRPSAAGSGYDAANSGGSNLGPTNAKLIERVRQQVEIERTGDQAVPIDLVTASGSGLDPHITPAAAAYQLARVARARNMSPEQLRILIGRHTEGPQLGILGEPRVNVLQLNRELDETAPTR